MCRLKCTTKVKTKAKYVLFCRSTWTNNFKYAFNKYKKTTLFYCFINHKVSH